MYDQWQPPLSYQRQEKPELWVASNADEVELLVNGKSIGRQRPSEYASLPHPLFKFALGDGFQKGIIEAIAYRHGEVAAREQMRAPELAQSLQLVPDDSKVLDDGADLTRLVVYALDGNGTTAPYEDRTINIDVQNGRLLGMNKVHLEGGRIAFYVQAQEGHPGPIAIRVSADGLKPAQRSISVQPVSGSVLPFGPFDLQRNQELKFVPTRR